MRASLAPRSPAPTLLALGLALLALLASSGARADDAPARLVLWHAYGESEARGLERAVDAFEAREARAGRPVRVEVTAIPFGAYATKLQTAIPAGHGPDLFIDAHDRIATYVEAGLVRDYGALAPELASDFEPSLLEVLRYEGALFGVPLSVKSLVLYVNLDLAGDARLDRVEDFERLLDHRPEGVVPLAWEIDSAYAGAALFHAYGARYLDDEGRYALEGERAERALERMRALVSEGAVPEESSGELVRNLFRSGRAVGAVSGPWLAPDLPRELRWAVRPLPRIEAEGEDARLVPFSTIEAAFLVARAGQRDAAEPALARSLALFLAGREGALVRAREGGHVVASRAAWEDPSLAREARLRAFHDAAIEARPMPTHPHMSRVFGPVDRAIRKVLRGDLAPREALVEARHRFEDETRPPPPPRDPTWALVAVSSALLLVTLALARQITRAEVRAALARSLPAYAWIAHAFVVIVLLVVLPLAVGALASFFAGEGAELHYVGVANYVDILSARGGDLLGHGSFWVVLAVTVLWTVANVSLHVAIGLVLALLLSSPLLRLKALYRLLLILPWAVPSYVTALAWRGMFHRQLGAVNALLDVVGVPPVSWFAHFSTAFAANVATNVWLGFPFMMVVTLGALTAIPKDLYEAAEVDGAGPLEQFRSITLPLLRPALLPAVAMGAVWTFNMFNVVFLVSAGEPDGSTEILVSEAYRWAFTRGHQTGYAAAYAVLIFGILLLATRRSGAGARARRREVGA